MRTLLIAIAALIIVIAGVSFYRLTVGPSNTGQTAVACTMEARLCPDGSYVGRVGPDCHFAQCPGTASGTPAVAGTVVGGIDIR